MAAKFPRRDQPPRRRDGSRPAEHLKRHEPHLPDAEPRPAEDGERRPRGRQDRRRRDDADRGPRGDADRGPRGEGQAPTARPRPRAAEPAPTTPAAAPAASTAWEAQAAWYDGRHGERGDDLYRDVVLPAVLRNLGAKPEQRVLDVCCGQGVLGRVLAEHGVRVLGVDASPSLIEAARGRAGKLERYEVGDARDLAAAIGDERADHAALVMALQDLDPIAPVLAGVAARLPKGGRLVIVLNHPCFRIPKRSGWGWDDETRSQYRRIDTYLSPLAAAIRTHPGKAADSASTTSFHRPLAAYLTGLGAAGLGVVGAEELVSPRRGTKGPRYAGEDLAAREIPVFLVLTAVKLA